MKYDYKLTLIILLILKSQFGFSQKVILEEKVPVEFKNYNMTKGPNKKKFSSIEFSFGTFLPFTMNEDQLIAFNPSFEYQLSTKFKRKVSPILSLTNVFGISHLRIQAKNIYELHHFGISSSALDPKFRIWNLMYQFGLRFNIDPNRGNQLGKYIEMNVFGYYNINSTLRYEFNTNLNDKTIIKDKNPNSISNFNYGLKLKFGLKNKSIFGSYRLSEYVENRDIPKLSIGVSSVIGIKEYR